MSVAFVSQGTTPSGTTANITGTTSTTPALPGSLATGHLVLIFVFNRQDGATPTTPSNWDLVGTAAGGSGSAGNDSGPVRITCFSRVKDDTWSTMPAITITSGNACMSQAFAFSNATGNWEILGSSGVDTTSGAQILATMTTDPGYETGDWAVVGFNTPSDGPAWSSQSFTATGTTIGTTTERSEPKTTQGNDLGGCVFTADIASGTSAAEAVVQTQGTIGSLNVYGPVMAVRIREAAGTTEKTGSESNSLAVSESSEVVDLGVPGDVIFESAVAVSERNTVTPWDTTAGLTVGAGKVILFGSGFDNASTTTPTISSITVPGTETAEWERIGFHDAPAATANTSLRGELWMIKTTVAWSNFNPSVAFSSAVQSKSGSFFVFSGVQDLVRWASISASHIDTAQSVVLTGNAQPDDADLIIALFTNENNSVPGEDTDTTNGSWVTPTGGTGSTTGGTNASNIGHRMSYKVVTADGDQTVNASSITNDNGVIAVALIPEYITSKSASESNSLAVSEASEVVVILDVAASESNSLSTSESTILDVTQPVSESNSLSVSEVSATDTSSSTVESNSLSVSESVEVLVQLSSTDSSSLGLSGETGEVDLPLTEVSGSESNALSVSETIDIVVVTVASDDFSLSTSESTSFENQAQASESVSLSASESVVTDVAVTTSDAASLSVSELTEIIVSFSGNESIQLSAVETSQSNITVNSTEEASISASESIALNKELQSDDTISLAIAEVEARFVDFESSDSASVAVSEQVSGQSDGVSSDSIAMSVSESVETLVTVLASDTTSISTSESSDVQTVAAVSVDDTASLAVSESTQLDIQPGAADLAGVAVSESAVIESTGTTTDSGGLSVSETTTIFVDVSSTDSIAISVSETTVSELAVTGSDSISISVVESTQPDISLSRTDTASLAVSEQSAQTSQISSSDTSGLATSEDSDLAQFDANIDVVSSDTLTILMTEFRKRRDPNAEAGVAFACTSTDVYAHFETETDSGIIVDDHNIINRRVEGDSETI